LYATNELAKLANWEAEKGEPFVAMGISKNTHLKTCQEEDDEKTFLRRNPKDYTIEFYN
jgi:hypothetical protein